MSHQLSHYGFTAPNSQPKRLSRSTSRSRPSKKTPRSPNDKNIPSPSPSTKRKLSPTTATTLMSSPKKHQYIMDPKDTSPTTPNIKKNQSNATKTKIEDPHLLALHMELMTAIGDLQVSLRNLNKNTQEATELKQKNNELETRVTRLEEENKALNTRVKKLEDKMLESSIIMHGVSEAVWEPEETTCGKVQHIMTHLVSGESYQNKMDQVLEIHIKSCIRLGRYRPMHN